MPLVEVHHLTKTYRKGDQEISPLEDADLAIERGEFVSLMGASGSGKSTLLNLLAGIDRPTAGEVLIAGTDITRSRAPGWPTGGRRTSATSSRCTT